MDRARGRLFSSFVVVEGAVAALRFLGAPIAVGWAEAAILTPSSPVPASTSGSRWWICGTAELSFCPIEAIRVRDVGAEGIRGNVVAKRLGFACPWRHIQVGAKNTAAGPEQPKP